jgi:hypothetical protein
VTTAVKEWAAKLGAGLLVVVLVGWGLYSCVADAASRSVANCEEAARKVARGEAPRTNVLDEERCRDHLGLP